MCYSCMEGTLIFKVSRFGSGYFIGCDQHPKCKWVWNITCLYHFFIILFTYLTDPTKC